MDTQRLILFVIFSFSALLLWEAWQKETPAAAGAAPPRRGTGRQPAALRADRAGRPPRAGRGAGARRAGRPGAGRRAAPRGRTIIDHDRPLHARKSTRPAA